MKIKVGNNVYDANEQPIMVILEKTDKENIANMHPDCTKYCSFPENMSEKDVEEFMKINNTK